MQDIIINITNYLPTDQYVVNVYKRDSQIPVVTKSLGPTEGPSVVFKGLPEGTDYFGEVVHICNTGNKIVKRQIYSAPLQNTGCACPPGYQANADKTRCIKVSTIAPTMNEGVLNVGPGPKNVAYCREGINVYAPGYNNAGQGAIQWASGNANDYWASLNTTTKGRLNIAGVWNSADSSLPLNEWIGFSQKIIINTGKVYYVAMAGDNYIRIKVNGQVIVDQMLNGLGTTNPNFNYWHCYPVYLAAGENIIELYGRNTDLAGCFAAEIYDCDLVALQNVTTGTESTLNRVFTSGAASIFTNNYSCPEGYALDNTGSPVCKKIEYTNCQ